MMAGTLQLAGLVLLGIGMVLGLIRFLRGPTTVDRIVAADTLSILVTSALVWTAHLLDSSLYLGVALVYAALSFVGTVAMARAIEGRHT
jgi:multicomponent Na+:H+ antiporter subunit F